MPQTHHPQGVAWEEGAVAATSIETTHEGNTSWAVPSIGMTAGCYVEQNGTKSPIFSGWKPLSRGDVDAPMRLAAAELQDSGQRGEAFQEGFAR